MLAPVAAGGRAERRPSTRSAPPCASSSPPAARRRRRAGSFAVEILGKRLLSCPTAFAESWRRCKEGLGETSGGERGRRRRGAHAASSARRATTARRSRARRRRPASSAPGSRSVAADLAARDRRHRRGASPASASTCAATTSCEQNPAADARFDALVGVDRAAAAHADGAWRDDERLVVFTEYKTTLDYLAAPPARALRARAHPHAVRRHGRGRARPRQAGVQRPGRAGSRPAGHRRRRRGPEPAAHRALPAALRLPVEPLEARAAQRPPRPPRPGARRHGPPLRHATRTRTCAFLAHVIRKADEIREDLGSANELFDEAAHRRLVDGESAAVVQARPGPPHRLARGRAAIEADDTIEHAATDGACRRRAARRPWPPRSTSIRPRCATPWRRRWRSAPAGRSSTARRPSTRARSLNPGLPGLERGHRRVAAARTSVAVAAAPSRALAFSPEPFLERRRRARRLLSAA